MEKPQRQMTLQPRSLSAAFEPTPSWVNAYNEDI